jgi:methylamine utilization protein MauJ
VSLNVPVSVYQTEVTEMRTENRRVTTTLPFFESPPLPTPNRVTDEFLWFAALYREALNTNSPLYRYLCLYKIIEGITVRRSVTKVYPRNERIPINPADFSGWLNAVFPVRPERWDQMALDSVFISEALGRKIGDVRDNDLRPLRNDVGHMFDDADKTHRLWVDDAEQVQRVHRWLPITTCIARLMLKNDFPSDFLPGLDEVGNERSTTAATAADGKPAGPTQPTGEP